MPDKPLTASPGLIDWRYEPVPTRAPCLLLNLGGCLMKGPPIGKWGEEYIAWAHMPKRNKDIERKLGFL